MYSYDFIIMYSRWTWQPRWGPCSARLGSARLRLNMGCCIYIRYQDQTLIGSFVSLSLQMHYLLYLQTKALCSWQQMKYRWCTPYSTAEPSAAHFHPGAVKCKHTIPYSAWKFLQCKWPQWSTITPSIRGKWKAGTLSKCSASIWLLLIGHCMTMYPPYSFSSLYILNSCHDISLLVGVLSPGNR